MLPKAVHLNYHSHSKVGVCLQVGDWVNALESYVQQQQHIQAWLPTPEGIVAFRAGRSSGFADGYRAGSTQCSC